MKHITERDLAVAKLKLVGFVVLAIGAISLLSAVTK
jgi:hypothetical protein